MCHEHLQQGELRAGQFDGPAAARDLPGGEVHAQVGEGERLVRLGLGGHRHRVGAAAQQGADAGEQLVQLERLDQVVVGARVQAGDPVADRVAGGEHQDRGGVPRTPDAAGRGQPVHARHLDVQHDQVRLVGRGLLQGVRAVDGDLGVVPLEGEAALEGLAHGRLVVDDQDALGITVAFGGTHRSRFLGVRWAGWSESSGRGWGLPAVVGVSQRPMSGGR